MLIQLILPCRYGKVLQIIPEFFSACFFWQWNSSWWCGKHFHRTSFSVHSVCHWDIEPSVRMVKCAECSLTWSLFCLLPTCSSPTFLTALYWSLSLHFFIPKDHPISLSPTIFLLDSYLGKTCFFFISCLVVTSDHQFVLPFYFSFFSFLPPHLSILFLSPLITPHLKLILSWRENVQSVGWKVHKLMWEMMWESYLQ